MGRFTVTTYVKGVSRLLIIKMIEQFFLYFSLLHFFSSNKEGFLKFKKSVRLLGRNRQLQLIYLKCIWPISSGLCISPSDSRKGSSRFVFRALRGFILLRL